MIVVSDSTPIMTLLKIGKMDLLSELFGEVIIPKAVYRELTTNMDYEDEVKEVENASYFRVVDVEDDNALRLFRRATGLDDGESEAIIYSDSIHVDILLIDEKRTSLMIRNDINSNLISLGTAKYVRRSEDDA